MDRDGSNEVPVTRRPEGTADVLPDWGPRPRPSARADVLHGDASHDVICGRGGGDVIHGLGGNDTLFGDRCGQGARAAGRTGSAAAASGRDRLFGGRGHDRLFGHGHADLLDGGPGRDLLHSGPGHDTFLARDGARDRVICGEGRDVARVDRRDRVSGCERVRVG
jgi:RTX calcium-binding nonapeptide repeat (4 copies)